MGIKRGFASNSREVVKKVHFTLHNFLKVFCFGLIALLGMAATNQSVAQKIKSPQGNQSFAEEIEEKEYIPPTPKSKTAKEQYNLAVQYYRGKGRPKNLKLAEELMLLAANQGFTAAQNSLGILYTSFKPGRYDQALRWYREAADNGHPAAMYNLGLMYRFGKGVRRDYIESAEWIEISAKKGFVRAMNSMGYIYRKGLGYKVDLEKAKNWYRKAALRGHSTSQFNLARLHLTQYVDNPSKEIFQLAHRWLNAAALQGHRAASFTLGEFYETGKGVVQDLSTSWMWYSLASEKGSFRAVRKLAVIEKLMTPYQLRRGKNLLSLKRREQVSSEQRVVERLKPSSFQNSQCNKLPSVPWWSNNTHQKVAAVVNSRFKGDWSGYIQRWTLRLENLESIQSRGLGAKVPTGLVVIPPLLGASASRIV
jgi:TPR repeat protein